MSEIKLRAWNISGEQWEFFDLKKLACMGVYNIPYDMPAICNWDNYKFWCQQTGLKDKKRTKEFPEGQEIYEGDVISRGSCIGVVRIGDYTIEHPGPCNDEHGCGVYFDFGESFMKILSVAYLDSIEIIGTIHENGDLKGGK